MDHIPFGDSPVSRCVFYRRVCDLPATIDPPSLGRIIMKATHVWALTMPAPLGQSVKHDMGRRGAAIGPILSHPRSNRWTFLIRPDVPDDVPLFADLFRHNASVIRDGGTVALPSPTIQSGAIRQWIEPPRDTFRPSGLLVIESVRACVGPGRARAVSHV
ncbi:DNA-directed RNA polymerase subunit beta [Nocardia sp. NBC_00403]|uniref:DNA-directed RNA polymerase subunit beta n=1 Tax=Nocardia sp. NBC_00403 TaxID=2975990 RepID=UPI002E243F6A